MADTFIQTAASIRIYINDTPIGWAQSLTINRNYRLKDVKEIDNPFTVEFMPTSYSVTGTISGFRLRDSADFDGFNLTKSGDSRQFLGQNYAVIEVRDRLSGKTLAKISKVLMDSDQINITSRAPVIINGTYRGVFVENEAS